MDLEGFPEYPCILHMIGALNVIAMTCSREPSVFIGPKVLLLTSSELDRLYVESGRIHLAERQQANSARTRPLPIMR